MLLPRHYVASGNLRAVAITYERPGPFRATAVSEDLVAEAYVLIWEQKHGRDEERVILGHIARRLKAAVVWHMLKQHVRVHYVFMVDVTGTRADGLGNLGDT